MAEFKQCPRCNAQVPQTAKICAACGAALPKPRAPVPVQREATKVCPSCRTTVPSVARICGSCGAYFYAAQRERPAAEPPVQTTVVRPQADTALARLFAAALVVAAAVFVYQHWLRPAAQTAPLDAPQTAYASPAGAPDSGTFSGTIADLPQAAQDVLNFEPVESPVETRSQSIEERVEENCGSETSQFVGADDFPGSITVDPGPHGSWDVTWTLHCGGLLGGIVGTHPSFAWELTHDRLHLRELNSAATWATH